jgi:hypothetical protein
MCGAVSFIFNFGAYIGAVLIMSTLLPPLLTPHFFSLSIHTTKLLSVLASAPIAFGEHIGRFAYLSLISTATLLVLIVVVVTRFALCADSLLQRAAEANAMAQAEAEGTQRSGVLAPVREQVWVAAGAIVFQFTCHDVFGHVLHALERPTKQRVSVVSAFVCTAFLVLGAAVGLWYVCDSQPLNT